MEADATGKIGTESLARLLEFVDTPELPWSSGDLSAVWKHQLAAPLVNELATLEDADVAQVDQLARHAQPPVYTFEDLLHHPAPPPELLDLTRRFAKAHVASGQFLPQEIATLLYFGSILVARVRCGQKITSMEDRQFLTGLRQMRRQLWIDPRTRELLESGERQLAGLMKAE